MIWQQTIAAFQDKHGDVHTRIMKKNYETVPNWWFYTVLIIVVGLAMLACEGFGKQLQLPYWGVLLAMSLAFFFTLPIGVIQATTNQVMFKLETQVLSSRLFCLFLCHLSNEQCAATWTECHH